MKYTLIFLGLLALLVGCSTQPVKPVPNPTPFPKPIIFPSGPPMPPNVAKITVTDTNIVTPVAFASPIREFTISWSPYSNATTYAYEVWTTKDLRYKTDSWDVLTNTSTTNLVVSNNENKRFFLVFANIRRANVEISWYVTKPEISTYHVYYGVGSYSYTNRIRVDGARNTAIISNLVCGTEYYFNMTAIESSGIESNYDGEVKYEIPNKIAIPSRIEVYEITNQS